MKEGANYQGKRKPKQRNRDREKGKKNSYSKILKRKQKIQRELDVVEVPVSVKQKKDGT